jgi:hypothetical protein
VKNATGKACHRNGLVPEHVFREDGARWRILHYKQYVPKTVSQPEFFLCLRLRLFGGLHCAVPSKQISATTCERNKNADYNAENVMLHRVLL